MKTLAKLALGLLLLGIGVFIGVLINNVPYFTFSNEVGFGDIANIAIAVALAVIIPSVLERKLNNTRYIKDFLIDEVGKIIQEAEGIKELVDQCASGEITTDIKRGIIRRDENIDHGIISLIEQLNLVFPKKSKGICDDLTDEAVLYWDAISGGNLMNDAFRVDDSFIKKHDRAFMKITGFLKRCIHSINNY